MQRHRRQARAPFILTVLSVRLLLLLQQRSLGAPPARRVLAPLRRRVLLKPAHERLGRMQRVGAAGA